METDDWKSISMRSYSELVEILREREFELFTIRRNFEELSNKFSQLEKAFAINLGVHRALESELAIYKLGKSSKEPVLQGKVFLVNVYRSNKFIRLIIEGMLVMRPSNPPQFILER